MRNWIVAILVVCTTGVAAAGARAKDKPRPAPKKTKAVAEQRLGSVAQQMNIKLRLQRTAGGKELSEAIQHNQQAWEKLSPEERDRFRQQAREFLNMDAAEQEKLLGHYGDLIKKSAEKRRKYRRRARWLKVVVATLTPEQREELRQATPKQRAQRLLKIRQELIRKGVLKSDSPTTQPAKPAARRARTKSH